MLRLFKFLIGLVVMACPLTSCAYIRNIPANSTPVREARYYRTQDVPAFAAGYVADQALGYIIKGPSASHSGREWAPVLRLAIVGVGAFAWRQTDKGYRESGAMFIGLGATTNELRRIATLVLKGLH